MGNKQKSKKKKSTKKKKPVDKSVYKIVKETDQRLYIPGLDIDIESEEDLLTAKKISSKMIRTVLKHNAWGIANVQCDRGSESPLNMLVMKILGTKKFITMINPKIKSKAFTKQKSVEGCLSLSDLYVIQRPKHVTVEYYCLEEGKRIKKKFTDVQATVVCHEMAHLRGETMKDYGVIYTPENNDPTQYTSTK